MYSSLNCRSIHFDQNLPNSLIPQLLVTMILVSVSMSSMTKTDITYTWNLKKPAQLLTLILSGLSLERSSSKTHSSPIC